MNRRVSSHEATDKRWGSVGRGVYRLLEASVASPVTRTSPVSAPLSNGCQPLSEDRRKRGPLCKYVTILATRVGASSWPWPSRLPRSSPSSWAFHHHSQDRKLTSRVSVKTFWGCSISSSPSPPCSGTQVIMVVAGRARPTKIWPHCKAQESVKN